MGGLPSALLVLGSDSDWSVMEPCVAALRGMGVMADVRVCSAHRSPDMAASVARGAEADGVDVIIAAAGKAAHLPGVLAAYTSLPVIGVPIKASSLDGLDALLSIVQMPPGVPVATVAIDGAVNAAILAAQIAAVRVPALRERLAERKREMAKAVEAKDAELRRKTAVQA